jgi:hypothetical protein
MLAVGYLSDREYKQSIWPNVISLMNPFPRIKSNAPDIVCYIENEGADSILRLTKEFSKGKEFNVTG